MKVLFPFVGDSVGGSHKSSIELYKELQSENIEAVFLLHVDNGPLADLLKKEGIKYIHFPVKALAGQNPRLVILLLSMLRNVFRLNRFIRKNKITIVHGNDLRINLTWSLPAKLSKAKYIWHQRTLLSGSKLWRAIPYLCEYFIAISNSVYNSMPSNLSGKNAVLIFNPFVSNENYENSSAKEWIMEKYKVPEDKVLVGYVGRLFEFKQVHFIIESLVTLQKKNNINVHLIIAGTGSEQYIKQLERLVEECGLTSHVTFTGFVNEPLKMQSGIDVTVASSTIDAFGRTLVESMLQKTPVIASRAGGHVDIVSDGITGLLYTHGDKEEFIEQLQRLITDRKLKQTLVASAYKMAKRKYSSENHAKQIIDLYKKV